MSASQSEIDSAIREVCLERYPASYSAFLAVMDAPASFWRLVGYHRPERRDVHPYSPLTTPPVWTDRRAPFSFTDEVMSRLELSSLEQPDTPEMKTLPSPPDQHSPLTRLVLRRTDSVASSGFAASVFPPETPVRFMGHSKYCPCSRCSGAISQPATSSRLFESPTTPLPPPFQEYTYTDYDSSE